MVPSSLLFSLGNKSPRRQLPHTPHSPTSITHSTSFRGQSFWRGFSPANPCPYSLTARPFARATLLAAHHRDVSQYSLKRLQICALARSQHVQQNPCLIKSHSIYVICTVCGFQPKLIL